jgi:protein TonB
MPMRLTAFVLLSAALHAGLLWVPLSQQEHRIIIGTPYRISILPSPATNAPRKQEDAPAVADTAPEKIQPRQDTAQAAKPVITTARHATPPQTQPPAPAAEQTREDTTPTSVANAQNAAAAQQPSSPAVNAQQASLLRAQLQQAFRLQFHYPRLAIRRGWQGEVRLGLQLAADGALNHIRVIQSSGHHILDRAALDSLTRVERLPDAASILNGQSLALELPVRYRLL